MHRRGEAALAAADVVSTPSESAVAKRWRACVPVRLRYVALGIQIALLLLMRCVYLYRVDDAPPIRGMPSSSVLHAWQPDRASKPPSSTRASWHPPHRERASAARLHPPASHHGSGNVDGHGAGEASGTGKAEDAPLSSQVEGHHHHLANDNVEDGGHGPLRARASSPSPRSMPPFRLATEESGKIAVAAEADDSVGTERGKASKTEHHRKSLVGRVSGMGTGASKNLRELSERAAEAALKGRIGKSGEPQLFGDIEPQRSFVLNQARWREGDDLPFPRKKLRFQLTHYALGKVTQPLLDVLPASDPVRASLAEGKHGTCAVVGNGGSMLLYELGVDVDAHDVVIRLNGGPTKGFEKYVGRKTTFRMTNRNHMGFSESPHEAVLQHVSTPEALEQFVAVARQARQQGHAPVYALDPEFHEYAMGYMDKGVLSNGFYGVLLASALCHKVTVYGFLHQWKGSAKYHYYDDVQPDGQQSLRDVKESNRLAWFIGNRTTTHTYGEPCMLGSGSLPKGQCVHCPPTAATCQAGVWHPVPIAGRCFLPRHPKGDGVPDVRCFHRCEAGDTCPGGIAGLCPKSLGLTPNAPCTDGGFVQP